MNARFKSKKHHRGRSKQRPYKMFGGNERAIQRTEEGDLKAPTKTTAARI